MGRADTIFTAPKPPSAPSIPTPSGGGGGGGGGGGTSGSAGSGGSSGGGGGGGGSDPFAFAKAQERKADREARNQHLEMAATLQQQIAGLRKALGPKGFKERLDRQLRNIRISERQTDAELLRQYRERFGTLAATADDNEKAASDASYANLANRSRERANALSEAQANGAGESDMLRAQQMSLRNWQANQHELNRSFYDTRTSIRTGLVDLTTDTRGQRMTNETEANADREMVTNSYWDRRSEALTALGNTLGQQAQEYSLANQAVASKGTKAKQKHASHLSGAAFGQASLASGNGYESPGVSKKIRKWDGRDLKQERMNNAVFSSAATEIDAPRPEGSRLREWEQ